MKRGAALLEILCGLADRAGEQVAAVYSAKGIATHLKPDRSPLTEADLRADAVIRDGLAHSFEGIPVVTEESIPHELPAASSRYFLVDPLDGTKEFVARTGEFTVNIALIEEGAAVAGVVLAPALGEMYYAAVGYGAHRRDARGTQRIRTTAYEPRRGLRIVGSRTHGGDRLKLWVDSLTMQHTFQPAGSSLKFCRIAEGAADVYPRLGPTCLWDTAAADCVLQQAGGHVTDLSGSPLRYEPRGDWLNPEFVAWSDPACLALCMPLRAE
jgi:3'(2'), 5'-bisphosphate nucleotidase